MLNSFVSRSLIAVALIASPGVYAAAQDYSFSVPKLQMHVVVNPDASARIVYDVTFKNNLGAHRIDVVDIGVPHKKYSLDNVSATIHGLPLGDIRHSEFVSPGFEVHLGGLAIQPGAEGKLHCEFTMPDMVFQDTTRADYASLRITPTWFGGQYITGTTELDLAVHLPKSVKPDEALHHGQEFSDKVLTDEGTSVVWRWQGTRLDGPHMVGVSFPNRDMSRVVKVTAVGLLVKWFEESTTARVTAGVIFLVLFGIAFFRFTGGTGVTVYVLLSAGASFLFYHSPGWHLLSLPIAAVLLGINEWYLAHRQLKYMPPVAQIEGGGIKRGLTAPEAAALLELPISRVLGLVVFGMLKKGILRQVQAEPLIVEVDNAFRIDDEELLTSATGRAKFYRRAGQQRGIVVHKYEQGFIYLLQNNPDKPVKSINFAVPLKQLIARVAARLKGFDVSDTKAYYRAICSRAVKQAGAIGNIAQRTRKIDRHFEWILIDDNYPTVFTRGGYRPVWTRGSTFSGGPSTAPTSVDIPGTTSAGDVSASFAGWAENTMGTMASAISPGSLSVETSAGGFINLSGVDRVTGEFFQALGEAAASSGGSGGGGGCACAGCACACACAGGGR